MPKKYEISIEAQVLLKLLRIALGTEPMAADGRPVEPFPSDINWREVIQLSYKQKVSSLAVDGLKASGYDPREGKSGQQLEDLNAALKPWFDDVKNNEESYAYYLTVLSTLCQIFSANGLKPIILKGYGLSKNYPIPSHRGTGDIDIFLLDENDQPAGQLGDKLLQGQYANLFHKIEHIDSHHTQYIFKGILIENHFNIICDLYDKNNLFENYLREFIVHGCVLASDVDGAYLPSSEFTSLHLIRHSFTHCHSGGLNLRQLVDFYTFIRRIEGQSPLEKEVLEKTGLTVYACCVYDVVKMFFDGVVTKNPDAKIIAEDVFKERPGKSGLRNFFHWYHDRRKIRFLTGESWVVLTIKSVMRHLLAI